MKRIASVRPGRGWQADDPVIGHLSSNAPSSRHHQRASEPTDPGSFLTAITTPEDIRLQGFQGYGEAIWPDCIG